MTLARSWAIRTFAFPTVVLLGIANIGCPETVETTSNTGGTGAGAGGSGGQGALGGEGGVGGSVCTPETEICDKKDNDCDGEIDEVDLPGGCACFAGEEQPCYTGPAGTQGVGACVAGKQACDGGTWGECVGQVTPAAEECNLLDDDCNGTVDDMGTASCGMGACANIVPKCVNGQAQTCVPLQANVEVCDGVDNDCDGETDESDPKLGADCQSEKLGACKLGVWECVVGEALVCVSDTQPVDEVCDGIDNDCDGEIDEDVPGTGDACDYYGLPGVCADAVYQCVETGPKTYEIECFPTQPVGDELCDGLDNDCDGDVDEDNPGGGGACVTDGIGLCGVGTLTCLDGELVCEPTYTPTDEACDGVDNNCDGMVDEGDPGTGEPCGCGGLGIGLCQSPNLICMGGPVTYFQEDFSDNSAGWTLGPTWQIGPAKAGCFDCTGNPDPGEDHTPTADNGIAGVVIGGPAPTTLHGFYWLESPPFDTSMATGSVYLSFWRWLNSDYLNYMQNKVQVFDGTSWVDLPYGTTGQSPGVMDYEWTNHGPLPGAPTQPESSEEYPTQFDLTPYKNAAMRIRFGYRIGDSGVYTIGSWSIDDVIVAEIPCDE